MANPDPTARLSAADTARPLSEAPRGRAVRIVALPAACAADLVAEGLAPGARAIPEVQAPLGGPLLLRVGRARVAVSASVARDVLVEPDEAEPREPEPCGAAQP